LYREILAILALAALASSVSADGGAADSASSGNRTETMSPYECVGYLGYNPDSMVYVYRNGRGARVGLSGNVPSAENAARRKGISLLKVNVGLLKDNEIAILQCFLGKYVPGDRAFTRNPRLMCPRTGLVDDVYVGRSFMNQFRVFAEECAGR
jgi:hypothetical protein